MLAPHLTSACVGKVGSTDSISSHQVSSQRVSATSTKGSSSVFTSQFGGTSAAGTPLRGTISIKLSSQASALRGNNAASSLAGADAGDADETTSIPRRTSLLSTAADSSSDPSQVIHSAHWCTMGL